MADKKLYKSDKHKMLCGVCGGFADFFNIDPTIVRLIFVILGLIRGVGIIAYIICAVVLPSEFTEPDETEKEQNAEEENTEKYNKAPHTDEEFDSYFSKK